MQRTSSTSFSRLVLTAATTVCAAWGAACQRTPGVHRLYVCDQSPLHTAGLTVVRDAPVWRARWPKLGGCAGPSPPAVDFARRVVVVVAHGDAASTGYAVTVDSASRHRDTTVVHATRVVPGPRCSEGDMITAPVAAATIARAAGPVVLVTREVTRDGCG